MLTQYSPDTWHITCKGNDAESLKLSILTNLEYRIARDRISATEYDKFLAAAYAVAERLVERWIVTQRTYHTLKPKRVYYLSMEFLMGRALGNALVNLDMEDSCRCAMDDLGMDMETAIEQESDAGLGNGGLGRLAACFLDSMATLGIPAYGYGLRYDYGLFHQRIVDGRQVELPDNCLAMPNPWEIARPELLFHVRFGGHTENRVERDGTTRAIWLGGEEVLAMGYDSPVPGYGTLSVNTLRLWTAHSPEEFNFSDFNDGDYMAAAQDQLNAENITKVLYPNDNFFTGKELRLKQEYLLVSASMQDILRRYKVDHGPTWREMPDHIAIQLNDTHPALAIPEMLRLLLDEEDVDWETAWDATVRTFGYTNHTLLPEALEEWSLDLFQRLLPRHLDIIYLINHYFLMEVARKFPGDLDRLRRMSLISEDGGKRVRMAYLAVVGSHKVNGVAALHSKLMRDTIFRDFAEIWPERFTNKTNGITPRRWLRKANPELSQLITEAIGDTWIKDLDELRGLERFADDSEFQHRWRAVKFARKEELVQTVQREAGVLITPQSLFDVQVKRIHEYKRQLLFALYMIASYVRLKEDPKSCAVPRTFLVGGKAAPGYYAAKQSIYFVNRIADMINRDPATNGLIRVAFLPNYRVSLAEQLIPAADLSEQISTAGKEASGTGNMKFALNGALTIGTLDGANIEILEEVGQDNFFLFGLTAPEVETLWGRGYHPQAYLRRSPLLKQVMRLLEVDFFSPGEPGAFRDIYNELMHHDGYCLMADFDSYVACQDRVTAAYLDQAAWTRMSILNVARCGKFSSDRTIREYAKEIWGVEGVTIPPEWFYGEVCSPMPPMR
jgi:starch phosphorylase